MIKVDERLIFSKKTNFIYREVYKKIAEVDLLLTLFGGKIKKIPNLYNRAYHIQL